MRSSRVWIKWGCTALGLFVALALAAPDAAAQRRGRGPKKAFTHFESFENAQENTAADPRDINGNGVIDCGRDGDCTTITSCDDNPRNCDEWTLPLVADPDLQFMGEDPGQVNFKSPTGALFPPTRGTINVVSPGSLEVCPSDVGRASPSEVVPDRNDWHVHTVNTPDIDGMDTTRPGTQPKAFRGQNSIHWGRHVETVDPTLPTPRQVPVFGDTYCLQCINAFVLDRPGGMTLAARLRRGQSQALSFWHIADFCDDECFAGFVTDTADDFSIVEIRRADAGTTNFSAWERIEPSMNPYDGVQDTLYRTPTHEPSDDDGVTMCSPLTSYVAQGSAKGTDPGCGDGDGDGFGDCGNVVSGTALGEAGVGVWARTAFDLSPHAGKRIQFRFIATTLDGFNVFESYLEAPFQFLNPPDESFDDGWYIDDVRVSGLVR